MKKILLAIFIVLLGLPLIIYLYVREHKMKIHMKAMRGRMYVAWDKVVGRYLY